jgi:hypothetical protein
MHDLLQFLAFVVSGGHLFIHCRLDKLDVKLDVNLCTKNDYMVQ